MMKEALMAIGTTAREVLRNWRMMPLFILLYALLLACVYLFVSTREATLWQIVLTALMATLAPLVFFLMQGAGVSYTSGTQQGTGALARRALKTFWKLFIASIPLILLGVLVVYLVNKLQARYPLPAPPDAPATNYPATPTPPAPLYWQSVLFPSLRLLLLGIVLPLMAIHLWIFIAREGFKQTLKKLHRVVLRAFAPASMLVYTLGLVAFAFIPYFLIFKRTTVESAWLELLVFGLRLALAFVFTLWGWLITLGALARLSDATPPSPAPHAATPDAAAPLSEPARAQ